MLAIYQVQITVWDHLSALTLQTLGKVTCVVFGNHWSCIQLFCSGMQREVQIACQDPKELSYLEESLYDPLTTMQAFQLASETLYRQIGMQEQAGRRQAGRQAGREQARSQKIFVS